MAALRLLLLCLAGLAFAAEAGPAVSVRVLRASPCEQDEEALPPASPSGFCSWGQGTGVYF